MRFLTWANDPSDPRCELLFASAKHFGIELEPIGVGKEYRGGVSKIEWLAEWHNSRHMELGDEGEIVVCVDAFDCLFLRTIGDAFEEELSQSGAYVLYAGERWKRGRPDLIMQRMCDLPYCYPNAGILAGYADSLENVYGDLNRWSCGSMETREQWFVSIALDMQYERNLFVDNDAQFFYCCGGEWRRFQGEVVDGRFRNKRTGTYPYILHAPIPRRSLPIRERVAKELGII